VVEPLLARSGVGLRQLFLWAVRAGARAMRDFLPQIAVEYVPEPVMACVTGAEESFRNVNTPEEAERFAVQIGG
jgi:molybdopterin-guanine dinucleotide biosynthesis protein A